ncbi:hypothetical protein [Streptomyces sp. NPDC102476]|uniref:hypothetical protein n=1 Tax=Streptomyces sp. NPDC102476 TaxID=3366181 RepID=UPI00380566E8
MNPYEYAAIHGPRAGDRVRLGDSGLVIRVEEDSQRHGDEFSGAVASAGGAR